jgi:hypothetical protein
VVSSNTWPVWVIGSAVVAASIGVVIFMGYQTGRQVTLLTQADGAPNPQSVAPAVSRAVHANGSETRSANSSAEFARQLQMVRRTVLARQRQRQTEPDPTNEPVISVALARQALAWVGANADANAVWQQAIDDPTLPADSRKKLIEGLATEGFADPKNPTAPELPLIVSRLALIEQLAPDAIDDSNSAAFDSAYDNLLAMYDQLSQ